MPAEIRSADSLSRRIIARSFFRELRAQGYDRQQILDVANELLSLLIQSVLQDKAVRASAAGERAVSDSNEPRRAAS